jgi:Fe-S oxidoreductase/nitrate reductase gamma subunit
MATREIYWNVPHHEWLYLFAALALAVTAYGLFRHWRLIVAGGGGLGAGTGPALRGALRDGCLGGRLWRRPARGLAHAFILWGALALVVGTVTVFLEADFRLPVYRGGWYLFISLAMDLLGLLAVAGVVVFLSRRLVQAPVRTDTGAEDLLILGALLLVLVGGFVLEGMRLAAVDDPWRAWTPVGALFAWPFGDATSSGLSTAYRVVWWTHLGGALALLAWLPYSKLSHVVLAPLQQALRDPAAGVLAPVDFEDEARETYGLARAEELERASRLALEACTSCGRCQDVCPAAITGKSLNPRRAVLDLRTALEAALPVPTWEAVGGDAIWECLTCNACVQECPVYIQQPSFLLELRRYLTMSEGQCPPEAELALRNLEVNHNPWGFGRADRAAWAQPLLDAGMRLDPASLADDGWLLWVGCAGSFDARAQRVATSTARLLRAAGVPFAILGADEQCCGDPARRMGNEYLFQTLAEHNLDAFRRAGVTRVVTFCPHCHYVIGREYPAFGGDLEVLHHSELLATLVSDGRLELPADRPPGGPTPIAYHDSCYLARHSGITRAPRAVLEALPSLRRGELPRSGVDAFCCGGGGGHVFMEEPAGERVSHVRLAEGVAAGYTELATACPFCLTMLEDAAKTSGSPIVVSDIAELLDRALDPPGSIAPEEGAAGGQTVDAGDGATATKEGV